MSTNTANPKKILGIILGIIIFIGVISAIFSNNHLNYYYTENRESYYEEYPRPEYQEAQAYESRIQTARDLGLVQATVTRIIDGDTIEVNIGGTSERVRLIGVDSPERNQPGFNEATNFTRDRISGANNTVWLASSGNNRDRFDRLRRHVWLGVPSNLTDANERSRLLLNQILLDNGHAVVFGSSGNTAPTQQSAPAPQPQTQAAPSGAARTYCGYRQGVHTCVAYNPNASPGNCTHIRQFYPRGLPRSHPHFSPRNDGDNDGWGCE